MSSATLDSVSQLAVRYQLRVVIVQRVLAALAIELQLRLNGVPHYGADADAAREGRRVRAAE